jgi:tetratricopeptide (TPR) repeat protein
MTLRSRNNLAFAYNQAGRPAEAIPLLEEMLKLMAEKAGPDHSNTLTTRGNLAVAYELLGRWVEAESLRRDLLARRRKILSSDSPALAVSLAELGMTLLHQAEWSEAETVLRECLAIRETKLSDDWLRFNAMGQLGGALLGQKKFTEAEPLLLSGYEGMKQREGKIPPQGKVRLSEAIERLVQLYETWGKLEKAAEWRAKRPLGAAELPADVFARP